MEENTTPELQIPVANENSGEIYMPSSIEKKRAVMMYFLIGIILVALNNQKKNVFEIFHLKQSLGWRSAFLFLIVVSIVIMFIPIIKYVSLFVLVSMIAILLVLVKRAREGKYTIKEENKLSIFYALGGWIMTLFEVKEEEKKEGIMNNE